MAALSFALVLLLAILVFSTLRSVGPRRASRVRPRPARNDVVAGLAATALRRIVELVGSADRAGEAVPSLTSWTADGDDLSLAPGVAVTRAMIVDVAIEYASARARACGEPITETLLLGWLERAVTMAIGRYVGGGAERTMARMARVMRQPPPSAEELALIREEAERDKREIDELIGAADDSSELPRATVRRGPPS